MAEIFDPNQAMPDFDAQTAAATRARAVADFLRKQAAQQTQPQGQMVSGHFVAPHWTQYLANIMGQLNVGMADRQATDAETQQANAQNQAANQWRSSLPQAVQARAAVPGQAATPFGSRDEPQQDATAGSPAMPYQPVPVAARLKATLAGMSNPKTAREAVVWNAGMAEEAKREDEQQAKRENLQATLAQRAMELQVKSEDARYNAQQQLEFKRQMLEAQNQWHQLSADTQRAAAESRIGAARTAQDARSAERSADKIDKQIEHLSAASKTLAPMLQTAQTVQDMLDTYGNKAIPGIGYESKLPGVLLPAKGVENRAKVKAFANAMLRNQAGLSQTLSETENANLELLANGNYSEKEFRAIWPTLMDKINASATTNTAGFHPDAVETARKRGAVIDPIKSRTAKQLENATRKPEVPIPGRGVVTDANSLNSADAKTERIRIMQAELAKATRPADIEAITRELKALGAAPATMPRAAAPKAAGGWKIEEVR